MFQYYRLKTSPTYLTFTGCPKNAHQSHSDIKSNQLYALVFDNFLIYLTTLKIVHSNINCEHADEEILQKGKFFNDYDLTTPFIILEADQFEIENFHIVGQ